MTNLLYITPGHKPWTAQVVRDDIPTSVGDYMRLVRRSLDAGIEVTVAITGTEGFVPEVIRIIRELATHPGLSTFDVIVVDAHAYHSRNNHFPSYFAEDTFYEDVHSLATLDMPKLFVHANPDQDTFIRYILRCVERNNWAFNDTNTNYFVTSDPRCLSWTG